MNLEEKIKQRSDSTCELCGNTEDLSIYTFEGFPGEEAEASFMICSVCREQFEDPEKAEPNHWRCLNDAMWSSVPAVQVTAWQMLNHLKAQGWPQDLLDMMYMDEELKNYAQHGLKTEDNSEEIIHRDSNGAVIEAGDTVVLTKDLNVKGSSLTAKRGTAVRRVSLVHDNPEQIEGKVEGQQIVILTKFVKKV
ncbi:MAG TPA: PhnA domain-containing protein [Salegentibacter sp.]|uniref:PhnA domain-containing protein n=1 Tax=Salegentibacter sp. TaxID=1903072 RepID=UPI002F955C81